MDLSPHEFEILNRLAPPTPAAGRLVMRFDAAAGTLLSDMLDVALTALEQGDPIEVPTQADLTLLLRSKNPRVRAIGVRLAARVR